MQFVCQEGHGDFLAAVDERETCSYIVTIHTSRICLHPQFGPLTVTQTIPISCSPLLNPVEYESYINGNDNLYILLYSVLLALYICNDVEVVDF